MSPLRRPSPLHVWFLLLVSVVPLRADSDLLNRALTELPTNGPASFARILLPQQPEAARSLAGALHKALERVGALLDHEIIVSVPISSRLTRLVVALHGERGPVFLRIDRYRGRHEDHFLEPKVIADVGALWPDETFLVPSRP